MGVVMMRFRWKVDLSNHQKESQRPQMSCYREENPGGMCDFMPLINEDVFYVDTKFLFFGCL